MSIYEIAKIAGVSPSTVSKVINGKGNISDKTRKKILDIVDKTDFQPKTSAVQSYNNIAVIYRKSQGNIFSSSYTNTLLSGIESYFFDRELNLILVGSDKLPADRESFRLFCNKNRIIGAIFLQLKSIDRYILNIDNIIPIVVVNGQVEARKIVSIISDNFKGSYDAMKYLLEMGHRKIAVTVLDQQYLCHVDRLRAYYKIHEDYGLEIDKSYLIDENNMHGLSFKMLFDSWKQKNNVPTAIFALNDDTAISISSLLGTMEVSVPEDISMVGFDDYPYSIHLSPALTTVYQPIHDMGYLAASVVDECICNPEAAEKQNLHIFKEKLIIRHSVKKIGEPVPQNG